MSSLKLLLPVRTRFATLLPSLNGIRCYHSFYHVEPPIADPCTIENKILDKAYKEFVPQEGFTDLAVKKGAEAAGVNPSSLGAIFNFTTASKDTAMELALYHLKYARQQMIEENKVQASKIFDEGERLKFLMGKRLLLNKPIINNYHQALGRMILPTNIPESLKELHSLADDLSYYAGDKSTDFAWYSKRFAVAGAFVQSELFMLADKSKNYQDTLQFATDRLNEVFKLGKAYNSFEEWALFNGISTLNLIRSQLVRG
ncbi:hypothetical protein HII13_002173 [Brettanomyces bruxellensis]|nr:hypothetical protein HII13_002173 [Brettanomyces bruxellensis]